MFVLKWGCVVVGVLFLILILVLVGFIFCLFMEVKLFGLYDIIDMNCYVGIF